MPDTEEMKIRVFNEDDRKSYLYLALILIISVISHFPFVLDSIGEPDSARIATLVIDRINNGPAGPLENLYHTDTIPLYVLYLSSVMKLLNYNYEYLPLVMNYTNAVFATLVLIPSFFLIRRLFGSDTIAFCSVAAFIFAPSFFLASIYGAPHLIALSFFITSLYFYLVWIESNERVAGYGWLILSSAAFMLALLFKASIILGSGIFPGLLFLRSVKDKRKIALSIFALALAFAVFLLIRRQIIPPSGESITSATGLRAFIDYFLIAPTTGVIIQQVKPAILGAGALTSLLGSIIFVFYLLKKRFDIVIFIISWTALPNLYWFLIWGNNARHHLVTVLPLITMIIVFFYEKAPRFTVILTTALIAGNFFVTAPSYSTYFPSGNLFKSGALLEKQTSLYHTKAKEIAGLEADKIAVMGYFHNPYVYYELISSNPSYEAELLTSVRSSVVRIRVNNREYMICYTGANNPEAAIENAITRYGLDEYVFVSATHDLEWLKSRGFRTEDVGLLDDYHIGSFRKIFSLFSAQ